MELVLNYVKTLQTNWNLKYELKLHVGKYSASRKMIHIDNNNRIKPFKVQVVIVQRGTGCLSWFLSNCYPGESSSQS